MGVWAAVSMIRWWNLGSAIGLSFLGTRKPLMILGCQQEGEGGRLQTPEGWEEEPDCLRMNPSSRTRDLGFVFSSVKWK